MALTAEGVKFIAGAVVGSVVPFSNANTYIGIGDSASAFQASQADLQGANTVRKPMDVDYPLLLAPSIVFKATFSPSEANFAWNEWGIFNAATGGLMLNRAAGYLGTKLDGQTWVLEVELTFVAE